MYFMLLYRSIDSILIVNIHAPNIIIGADHPNFKEVSKLTVGHMKLPNEFNDVYQKKGNL